MKGVTTMKFECKCKFIGKEYRESKKGNKYIIVTLIQDGSLLSVISDIDINADFGKDFVAVLTYNQKFKDLRLVGAN